MICSSFKIFVLCFVFISLFHSDSVQSVRICGKRLADLLHFMCKHYGGFHSPGVKRRAFTDLENTSTDLYSKRTAEETERETVSEDGQISTAIDTGVVNECCRKQCTVATLISYCADGEYLGSLERLAELETLFSSNTGTFTEDQMEEETASETPAANNEMQHRVNSVAVAERPNLGTSTRNRPVFIVLPQVQEVSSSDMSKEENSESSL
ncbi:unnamed protein product [Larinioides sclopetarius]|uniref:Insulin-like domain-containing protein n=1 Tax=Larinioides sclopetarius TaxID=280406 RepID=A0AAV1YWR0_9ARAC